MEEQILETTESISLLLNKITPKTKTKKVHLTECHGMVLSEDVVADMMVPSFPKSAMDGYAVYSEDVKNAKYSEAISKILYPEDNFSVDFACASPTIPSCLLVFIAVRLCCTTI